MSICASTQHVGNIAFDKRLKSLLSFTISTIDVTEASRNFEDYVFLDIREKQEYDISHIPGAIHLGYDRPLWSKVEHMDRNTPIVVYCSVGYRSERLGKKLKQKGFTKVYNLYGSIFEWANQGLPLVDPSGKEAKAVHTYNKNWSQWLTKEGMEKVW